MAANAFLSITETSVSKPVSRDWPQIVRVVGILSEQARTVDIPPPPNRCAERLTRVAELDDLVEHVATIENAVISHHVRRSAEALIERFFIALDDQDNAIKTVLTASELLKVERLNFPCGI